MAALDPTAGGEPGTAGRGVTSAETWEKRRAAIVARDERLARWAVEVYSLPPAQRPYGQRGQYPKPPYPKDPQDGSPLCRWCGVKLSGRRTWCGPECVDEFMRRGHWPTMAKFIERRDRVCQLCGGERLKITRPHPIWYSGEQDTRPQACAVMGSGFAVDHILPVIRGGTDDPANLRLLCGRCHGDVTRQLAGELALERREKRAKQSGQLGLM